MRAFVGVDVQECLRRVVEENTASYKTDFEYDIRKLKNAALGNFNKDFLWLCWESGTQLSDDKHVYVKGTYDYNSWIYYKNHPEQIRAFFVHVDNIDCGKPRGYLAELDYISHCNNVEQLALPPSIVNISFLNGKQHTFDYAQYNNDWQSIYYEFGAAFELDFDTPGLGDLMRDIRDQIKAGLEPADFEDYMREIRLAPFERLGYSGDDFARLSYFDAQHCLKLGVPVYLFEQGTPAIPVCDSSEIDRFPYLHPYLLAIRREDAPVWNCLNPANKGSPQLFSYQELAGLQRCVAYTGKNSDATPGENDTLQKLLGKLNLLTNGIERRDFPACQIPYYETALEQGPEQ